MGKGVKRNISDLPCSVHIVHFQLEKHKHKLANSSNNIGADWKRNLIQRNRHETAIMQTITETADIRVRSICSAKI